VVAAVNGRSMKCKILQPCAPLQLSTLCPLALLTQSNDASTEPHHEFRPRAVCLLLGIARAAPSWSLFEPLIDVWRSLHRNAVITSTDQAILLLMNLDVGVGALGSIVLAGGTATVASFDLAGFLLCTFLIASNLLPGRLLFLQSLLLCELSAGFLDALSAGAGNSFTV